MRRRPLLQAFTDAASALRALCDCVGESDESLLSGVAVAPSEVPGAFQDLLVHETHMTPKLAGYHGGPVSLEVLTFRAAGDLYSRAILLRSSGGAVVEFGIVRMDLACTTKDVCKAILARAMPLGDILTEHGVLTRVEPSWYMRFEPAGMLAEHFGAASGAALYGRIGTIYFHDQPALELLEIVTDQRGG